MRCFGEVRWIDPGDSGLCDCQAGLAGSRQDEVQESWQACDRRFHAKAGASSDSMIKAEGTRTADLDGDAGDNHDETEVPRLVLALSLQQPDALGLRVCLASADEVVLGRGTERYVAREGRRIDVTIDDEAMSRRQLRLRRLDLGWELEDLGSKNGTLVNTERSMRTTLADGDMIEVGSTIWIFREAALAGGRGGVQTCRDRDLASGSESDVPPVFRTLELGLERRLADLAEVSPTQVPVFLRGETGTGKELIARAVHEMSGRRGRFVAINCGALPRTLLESELFGHRRGSFSEAREDRDGLVRRAHGGTLLLDEVVELPTESQVALLRVLQEGEVRPVGEDVECPVDVRVIAATNQDVERKIGTGSFRQDLYARLAGFELEMPPLRERREDLGILIAAILRRLGNEATQVTFQRQAARALVGHTYPMNVRELEQAIRAAVVFARGEQIRIEHLPEAIREIRPAAAQRPVDPNLREQLHKVLYETRGNVSATARALNKAPMQIRRWCRRLAIDLSSFRD
jgi:predicted ATP-dependent protease